MMRFVALILATLQLFLFTIFLGCSRTLGRHDGSQTSPNMNEEPSAQYDEAPKLIKSVDPEYPLGAFETGITGTVWLEILVDEKGRVVEAKIKEDSGKDVGFEAAALAAAVKTRWKPATLNGKPISVWITYKVHFDIK